MAELAFTRSGAGAPLVLLHGLGSSRRAWGPVIPALSERFDVIALDLPGFGDSEPLPPQVEPTPAALASSVAGFLDTLGIPTPHVAGNSLGGWIALELAGRRPVASLALLSPAGLWPGKTPLYDRISLRLTRWFARHAGGLALTLMAYRFPRILVLGQTHGRPSRIDPEYARMAIRAIGTCPGFDATMKAAEVRCYQAESSLDAPVTVAFGSRDFILLAHQSRHIERLPFGTHVVSLPGCGHVPMADDPEAVAALIIGATSRLSQHRAEQDDPVH
ncbi:MAG TPA: alpha/beta fold hydrolase [Candidatus Limnocylindrales bacterium]|nr:alpha/beta fold hydrolase [Candidatus Limnocylindrales bacterium]